MGSSSLQLEALEVVELIVIVGKAELVNASLKAGDGIGVCVAVIQTRDGVIVGKVGTVLRHLNLHAHIVSRCCVVERQFIGCSTNHQLRSSQIGCAAISVCSLSHSVAERPVAACLPTSGQGVAGKVLSPRLRIHSLGRGGNRLSSFSIVGWGNGDVAVLHSVGSAIFEGHGEFLRLTGANLCQRGSRHHEVLAVGSDIHLHRASTVVGHGDGLHSIGRLLAKVDSIGADSQFGSIGSLVGTSNIDDKSTLRGRHGHSSILGCTGTGGIVSAGNGQREGSGHALCPVGRVGGSTVARDGHISDIDSSCTCVGEVVSNAGISCTLAEVVSGGGRYSLSRVASGDGEHGGVSQAGNLVDINIITDKTQLIYRGRNIRYHKRSIVRIGQTVAARYFLAVCCPCRAVIVRTLNGDIVSCITIRTLGLNNNEVAI